MQARQVGTLVTLATLAVFGAAGCTGDHRDDSARGGQQRNPQVATDEAGGKQQSRSGNDSAYCSAVENFNGVLGDVPSGNPKQVEGGLNKVSNAAGKIVKVAPDNVRKDWRKLRTGFDRLNTSYDLLDGIDDKTLAKLQSANSRKEVDSIELGPKNAKKYERFQRKTSKISSNVEASGKKVSGQVERACNVTIGE